MTKSLLSQFPLSYEYDNSYPEITRRINNLRRRKDYKPLKVLPKVETHIPTFIKWFNKVKGML